MPETTKGKLLAIKALEARRANKPEQINNANLYAGSPVYYYCRSCGHLADKLSETHFKAPKRLCDECQALKDCGWLE